MNILITGATGFIGLHLSRALAAHHNVFGLTRTESSTLTAVRVGPVFADLSDSKFYKSFPASIDCVIHLAQSNRYQDFPEGVADMNRINIDATIRLLEWARKTDVRQFVFTSTANVYGETNTVLTESHSTKPSSFYGASKLAAEHLVRQYRDFFQVDILRLFTVYGPGQKGMLIPNIIEKITAEKPVTLAGGTGIYLSPIFVGDVVDVIHRLITSPSRQQCRLTNVCGDQIISLREILEVLESLLNQSAVISNTNDEVSYFSGSNDRLKNTLGTHRFLSIQAGLERTICPEVRLD